MVTGMDGNKLVRAVVLRSWNPTLKGMIGGINSICNSLGSGEVGRLLSSLLPLMHLQAAMSFWHSLPQLRNVLMPQPLCTLPILFPSFYNYTCG